MTKTTCIECRQEVCTCSGGAKPRKSRRDHFLVREVAPPAPTVGCWSCGLQVKTRRTPVGLVMDAEHDCLEALKFRVMLLERQVEGIEFEK